MAEKAKSINTMLDIYNNILELDNNKLDKHNIKERKI